MRVCSISLLIIPAENNKAFPSHLSPHPSLSLSLFLSVLYKSRAVTILSDRKETSILEGLNEDRCPGLDLLIITNNLVILIFLDPLCCFIPRQLDCF